MQTRRCPARHCSKVFTLPANETISSKPAQLARTLMSTEQLSNDLPGMKIKNTTQRNSWKGQPYLTLVNTGSSVLFSSRPNTNYAKQNTKYAKQNTVREFVCQNIDLHCFVAWQFFRKFTHCYGVLFTGLKIWCRTKNDKYQVWGQSIDVYCPA